MGNPLKRKKLRKLEELRAAMGKEIPSVLVSATLPSGFVALPEIKEEVKVEVVEEKLEEVVEIKEESTQEEKPSKKKKSLQGE